MATLRWKGAEPAPVRALVFVSEFRAPTWRVLIGMLRSVRGLTRQLRGADGALGYALRAQPLRRRLTTVSAWRDEASMRAFAAAEPHRTVTRRFGGGSTTPRFVTREQLWNEVSFDADRYLQEAPAAAPGAPDAANT